MAVAMSSSERVLVLWDGNEQRYATGTGGTHLEGQPIEEMADSGRTWTLITGACVDVEADRRKVAWGRVCSDTEVVGERCDLDGIGDLCAEMAVAAESSPGWADEAACLAHVGGRKGESQVCARHPPQKLFFSRFHGRLPAAAALEQIRPSCLYISAQPM